MAYAQAAGTWMRTTRHDLGLELKDFVDRYNFNISTLSRLELGKVDPRNLEQIISAYALEAHKTPTQARHEIIRLMFPEDELAQEAEALADDVDQEQSQRRQTN